MEIIYPMAALVFLTCLIGFSLGTSRLIAAFSGKVHPKYFRLMTGFDVPDHIAKLSRNFENLLEVPILFYVGCIVVLVTETTSSFFITTAWVFFVTRLAHTLIHITYNNPLHRFFAFLAGFISVIVLWVNLVLQVMTA